MKWRFFFGSMAFTFGSGLTYDYLYCPGSVHTVSGLAAACAAEAIVWIIVCIDKWNQ